MTCLVRSLRKRRPSIRTGSWDEGEDKVTYGQWLGGVGGSMRSMAPIHTAHASSKDRP
jgi:hypothetical protein